MNWPTDLLGNPAYDSMVLGAISEGRFEHVFVPIVVHAGGHTGIFRVSQDALKIDGVRINVSAILQQQIADMLGAYLLTPKLLDQLWAQRAVTLTPCTQPSSSTSAAMIVHSACIDTKLKTQVLIDRAVVGAGLGAGIPADGIVQTVGKTWAITNALLDHPGMACNIGWHLEHPMGGGIPFDAAPTLPGAHMIQSPGYRHDARFLDYCQLVLVIHRDCVVDDSPNTFAAVARDSELAPLVNADGVLKVLRQPGAPELVKPPTTRPVPLGPATVALMGVGMGIGAKIAGPPGAVVGGALGLAVDAIRRRFIS